MLAPPACCWPPCSPAARRRPATPPSAPSSSRTTIRSSRSTARPSTLNLFLDRILLKPVDEGLHRHRARGGAGRAEARARQHEGAGRRHQQRAARRVRSGAGIAVGRFAINTTLGVGGMFDVAAKWGLDTQTGDFGQTLFVWGLPEGPYLILPLLGPSNPRDADRHGGVDYLCRSFQLSGQRRRRRRDLTIGRFVVGGIDQRARVIDILDDLREELARFLRPAAQPVAATPGRRAAPRQPRRRAGAELLQRSRQPRRRGPITATPAAPPHGRSRRRQPHEPGAPAAAAEPADRKPPSAADPYLRRADLCAVIPSVAPRCALRAADQPVGAAALQHGDEFRAPRRQLADRAAEVDVDDLPARRRSWRIR